MWVKILLVFIFIEGYCLATCLTRMDCGQCHYCDVSSGSCFPVAPMEDPYNECPFICGTPTVCNEFQHCILKGKPDCDCDYTVGACTATSTVPTIAEVVFELDEETRFNVFLTIINVFCFLFILIVLFWKFPFSFRPKKH